MAVLLNSYTEETLEKSDGEGDTRIVLKLKPAIAPYKIAVLPLVNKLNDKAAEIWDLLKNDFSADFDTSGTIGKRYRRQDEIGTPFCITVDFDTVEKDQSVTIRDRDSMKQERIKIDQLKAELNSRLQE